MKGILFLILFLIVLQCSGQITIPTEVANRIIADKLKLTEYESLVPELKIEISELRLAGIAKDSANVNLEKQVNALFQLLEVTNQRVGKEKELDKMVIRKLRRQRIVLVAVVAGVGYLTIRE